MAEDCPRDCPMAQRIIALEEDNRRHKETHGKMYDRIGKLEADNAVQTEQFSAIMKTLDRMEGKYDKLADKMDAMERATAKQAQTLDELNERGKNNQARLDALEAKPGKRWDAVVAAIISSIATAFVVWLLSGGAG